MVPPISRSVLTEQLATARRRLRLSIRRVAAIAKVPASTAQGWLDGRHLPTPALMPQFMTLLRALQLVTVQDEEDWALAIEQMRRSSIVAEPPYVGLRPYTVDEASLFVGRERTLTELYDACSEATTPRIVFLVGPPGTGKSSLLTAGLIGRGTGSDGPLSDLSPVQLAVTEVATWTPPEEPTLLVVDQFEDLRCLPGEEAAQTVEALCRLPARVTCVLSLNTNATGEILRHDQLAPFLVAPVLAGPLTSAEYRSIIEVPARLHGRAVGPELVQVILRDLHQYGYPDPGTILPLLSSALRRAWKRASGDTLSTSDYLTSGGLWNSLNDEAEAIWSGLPEDQRTLVRRLLLSLVASDEEQLLRRSIPHHSLDAEMAAAAEPLIAVRLLRREDGQLSIAHDALLTRWKRLRGWVEQEDATLRIGRRIHMAARLWDEGGRSPEALLPIEAESWASWAESDTSIMLSESEREFISASVRHGLEERRRQSGRLPPTLRRQRLTLAAIAGCLLLAIMTTVLGVRATMSAQETERTARTAQSQRIALLSEELRASDPNLAAQLAVAAFSLEDNHQTRSSVLESAGGDLPYRVQGTPGHTSLAVVPQGSALLRGDDAGRLSLWRDGDLTASPEIIETGGGPLAAVAVTSHSSRLLAIVAGKSTASVWDLTATPKKLGDWATTGVPAHSVHWQGEIALIGTGNGQILRIDLQIPDYPEELEPLSTGEDMAISALTATSDLVVAGGPRNQLLVFTAEEAPPTKIQVPGQVLCLASSPDGAKVVAGLATSEVLLFSNVRKELTQIRSIPTQARAHALAHLGSHLLIGQADGAVTLITETGQLLERHPAGGGVSSVLSSPVGVVAGTTEGTVELWRPSTPVFQGRDAKVLGATQAEGLTLLQTSHGPKVITPVEAGASEIPIAPPPDGTGYQFRLAHSRSGQLIAAQSLAGQIIVLRREDSGYEVDQVLPPGSPTADMVLSPDGQLLGVGAPDGISYDLYRRRESGWETAGSVPALKAGLAFNEDGTLAVTMSLDGTGYLLTPVTGTGTSPSTLHRLPGQAAPSTFAFSPTGELAVGSLVGAITLLDVSDQASPHTITQLSGPHTSLERLRYSSDGGNLVAVTGDGELWAWDRQDSGSMLRFRLRLEYAAVNDAHLDGDRLLVALSNGTATMWSSDVQASARELCSRVGHKLTFAEWIRIAPGVPFVEGCR